MLLALTRSAGLQFSWWVLPLAITWGWALGQVTAYFGYTFKSRQNQRSEKLVLGWVMVATVISTADVAAVRDGSHRRRRHLDPWLRPA